MIYGLDKETNEKILAFPENEAVCPICKSDLIPKCGEIKIWHWAHKNIDDCDTWYEPESEWHIGWKNLVNSTHCEYTMGKHRADIITKYKVVVELQNSQISSIEIKEREEFYKNMFWIINAEEFVNNINFRYHENGTTTFRWKHPRKSWWFATKSIVLDCGYGKLFIVKKIHPNVPCGGNGHFVNKEKFISNVFEGILK